MTLTRRPITLRAARRFIAQHHRHSRPPQGWLFASSLIDEHGQLVAVGIAGRPLARHLDDGVTIEITRVCTLGHRNACSMLYSALCRAAAALGYERAVTYLLEHEDGASVKASGFSLDGWTDDATWGRPSRPRRATDLFGETITPAGRKSRWIRYLAPVAATAERATS